MREIKFRAWDKKGQIGMVEEADLHVCQATNDELKSKRKKERYILMQFTGLKDKNGKEIFEGDIVKVSDNEKIEEDFVGVIIFSEKHLRFEFDERYLKEDSGFVWTSNWFEYPYEYEVIGNKFENPELLEECS